MSEGPPIIITGIALILVAIALLALRNRGKLKQPIVRNKKSFLPLFIIGLVLSLTAAFLCLMVIFLEKILQALQRSLVL